MNDEFTLVKNRRSGRKKRATTLESSPSTAVVLDKVRDKVQSAKNDLACSDYWTTVKTALGLESVTNLICLGLGQFSSNVTSRWQTALLVLLKDYLGPQKTLVYDPLFHDVERTLLAEMGCEVPAQNDEGILSFANSLYFMPHCGKPLFNSVVFANRKHLKSTVIFGNSFSIMFEQLELVRRFDDGHFVALKEIEQSFEEVPVKNNFQFKDVFNDLSVVTFNCNISKDIPRPIYSAEHEIILSSAMQQLTTTD